MKIFYNLVSHEGFALTDVRLRMYQRLRRLHNENSAALSHVLRIFAIKEPAADEHQHIIQELLEVNFLRHVEGGIMINTDQIEFINFILNREYVWHGLLNGGNKLVNLTLLTDIRMADTDIQMGEKSKKTKDAYNIQEIQPEVMPEKKSECRIL